MTMSFDECVDDWAIAASVLMGLLLRACTSLHPYSGQHTPPMFGDFEAQRHWMEITYNLPVSDWYFNSTQNNLLYWGLDYPPLTAYHSWICGYIANLFNEHFVALRTSRGFESFQLKLFMRYSVLIADILVYMPALAFYFFTVFKQQHKPVHVIKERKSALRKSPITTVTSDSVEATLLSNNATQETNGDKSTIVKASEKSKERNDAQFCKESHTTRSRRGDPGSSVVGVSEIRKIKNVTFSKKLTFSQDLQARVPNFPVAQSFIMALLYPGIILIDHGHFQYNGISLGLTIFATTLILIDQNVLASVLFCLALNYKQMELYHALPFFFYLIHFCLVKTGPTIFIKLWKLTQIGATVLLTFIVIWLPFLKDSDTALRVLRRLFPVDRGVYEDKVSNYWCFINIFIKLKANIDNETLATYCLVTTGLALVPCCLDLLFRADKRKFLLALINCSLGFYLFSFQVHEKSILIAASSVLLYFHKDSFVCFWFLYISCFSMLPLFVKDQLLIAYIALIAFYLTAYRLLTKRTQSRILKLDKRLYGRNQFSRELLITLLNVTDGDKDYTDILTLSFKHLMLNMKLVRLFFIKLLFVLSLCGSLCLLILLTVFEPPSHLPDLFPLLISLYCFAHFCVFFLYFNCQQLLENGKLFKAKLKVS